MPSRIAALITQYVIQMPMIVAISDTAIKKIACLAISASSVCKFMVTYSARAMA